MSLMVGLWVAGISGLQGAVQDQGQDRSGQTNVVGAAGGGRSVGQTIGIEGRTVVELPSAVYQERPLDDRTELILRIERVEPLSGGRGRYHLHFIGMEPGQYRLADYLIRPDGSRPDELGDVQVTVASVLPKEHSGQLNAHVPDGFPFIGGYRVFLVVLGVLWVVGLAAFAWHGRRRAPAPVAPPEPEPSLAERLRPFVEAAAMGRLDTAGQAQLERLLMGYWRERLSLPDQRMAEAVACLKAHAEAGVLLRAVERWLHQPGGGTSSEVRSLLEPYRRLVPAAGGASAVSGEVRA